MIKTAFKKLGALFTAVLFAASLIAAPAQAQFYQQATWGGNAAGTANAQIITIPNVQKLSDVLGVVINFIPGAANTSAATVILSGLTATNILKPSPTGLVPLTGGELGGGGASILYDGVQFQLLSPNPVTTVPSHVVEAFHLSSCPSGWAAANGSGGTVNLVGYFIRGLDTAGIIDPNARTLGSIEAFAMQNFYVNTSIPATTEYYSPSGAGSETSPRYGAQIYSSTSPISAATNAAANVDLETRPVNVALLYCEKL
jgi:hypothetical protein